MKLNTWSHVLSSARLASNRLRSLEETLRGFDKAVDAATRADPFRFRADRGKDAGAYRDGGTPVALRTLNLLLRRGASVGDEADPGHQIEAAFRDFLGKL